MSTPDRRNVLNIVNEMTFPTMGRPAPREWTLVDGLIRSLEHARDDLERSCRKLEDSIAATRHGIHQLEKELMHGPS